MMLTAQFAPIYWTFAGLLAPMTGSHAGAINHAALPIKLPLGLQFREDASPQPVPDSLLIPFEESATTGMARWEIARRRKAFPRHAGLEDKDDAGHHLARVRRFSARVLHIAPLPILRKQWLKALPQLFR